MQWIWEKINETLSNFWVKSIALIPVSLFAIEEREKVMLITFTVIITVDCIFGAMKAIFCDDNFRWDLLGKKFSKKFLLYFFTLSASFILSNAYDFMEYWFYIIGTIIIFSEFGSMMHKARKLGLPVDVSFVDAINKKINIKMKMLLGIECVDDCSLTKKKRR